MANVTATNWTVTYRNGNRNIDTQIAYKKRMVQLKLSLAASGKTWPKAGVLFPTFGQLGMVRYVDSVKLEQGSMDAVSFATAVTTSSGRSIMFAVGVTGKRLYAYHVKAPSLASAGPSVRRMTSGDGTLQTALNFYVTAVGW